MEKWKGAGKGKEEGGVEVGVNAVQKIRRMPTSGEEKEQRKEKDHLY